MNPSTALGRVLVDELIRGGVREAVISPGSRSAPLALALYEADQQGRLRLHVRVDERTAGFCALGLAKASDRPVLVLTTSGTAAANLHPAVVEATESGLPLVAVTADRPPSLRGTGANQTVDQVKLFGTAVRLFAEISDPAPRAGQVGSWRSLVCRALAAASGSITGDSGPVHLNIGLREPLLPDGQDSWPESLDGRAGGQPWTQVDGRQPGLPGRRATTGPDSSDWPQRTLVLVGDAPRWLGSAVRQLAETHGWPVISEASGHAREGTLALRCGHLLLADPDFAAAHRPERVLVVGHPTLHRAVSALLADPAVTLDVVTAGGRWADQGAVAARVWTALPAPAALDAASRSGAEIWAQAWLTADAAASAALDRLLEDHADSSGTVCEPAVARDLHAALPPGALLVVGSSMPVRDLCVAVPRDGVTVLANRGAAGIDGTVSTAVGAALAWQRDGGGPAFALMGDLTFAHDGAGLALGPGEPRPDLTIVVVNNDGGGIFGLLEQGEQAGSPEYERVFATPQRVDLAALCAATGTAHTRVDSLPDLVAAVSEGPSGLRVVEVRTDRAAAASLAAAAASAVRAALAGPPAAVSRD